MFACLIFLYQYLLTKLINFVVHVHRGEYSSDDDDNFGEEHTGAQSLSIRAVSTTFVIINSLFSLIHLIC